MTGSQPSNEQDLDYKTMKNMMYTSNAAHWLESIMSNFNKNILLKQIF
jgi:hypothetical protein